MLSGADVISGELLHILSVFQHCQIINVTSLCNNVMNKVLAGCGTQATLQSRWWATCACVRVCVCIHPFLYVCVCVFIVPDEVKARRGWVTSYSLKQTDGDSGVCFSTVGASVLTNTCALQISWAFHKRLQLGALYSTSPFSIALCNGAEAKSTFSILKPALYEINLSTCRFSEAIFFFLDELVNLSWHLDKKYVAFSLRSGPMFCFVLFCCSWYERQQK